MEINEHQESESMSIKANKPTSVYLVFSGTAYESNNVVGVYASKDLAEKRVAKIEKEQATWQKSLQNDDPETWAKRKWSDTASQDYAYVTHHKVIP